MSLGIDLGVVAQFVVDADAFLTGVARQLDAVDGEHGSFDEALRIAGHEHLSTQRFDWFAQRAEIKLRAS